MHNLTLALVELSAVTLKFNCSIVTAVTVELHIALSLHCAKIILQIVSRIQSLRKGANTKQKRITAISDI